MTKLMLVSDYDGTFKSDIKNLKINIEAINKFREAGNIFAISTGRMYKSIKKECRMYNINYDYLFCNDGAVLFDSEDNIIYKETIDTKTLLEISSIINEYEGIKSIEYYNSYDKTDLVLDDSIIQILINLKILNDYKNLKKYITNKFPDIKMSKYFIYSWLTKNTDKSKGLEILANKLSNEISRENIITIGDNFNDLAMLKDFNGYRILLSYPVLYGKGLKVIPEVHRLIKKIEKKKNTSI